MNDLNNVLIVNSNSARAASLQEIPPLVSTVIVMEGGGVAFL